MDDKLIEGGRELTLTYQNHEKWIFTIACIVVSWVWFFVLAMLGKELADLIKMELF